MHPSRHHCTFTQSSIVSFQCHKALMKCYTVWYLILQCVALALVTVSEGNRLVAALAEFMTDDMYILFFSAEKLSASGHL